MTSTQLTIPSRAALVQGLRTAARSVASNSAFLKMDKSGEWVFGADMADVPPGQLFIVNPGGFVHGYVCWGDGEKLGEQLVPVHDALEEPGPLPAGSAKGWERQLGAHLIGLDGALAGLDLAYVTSSFGGRKAVAALADTVAAQIEAVGEAGEIVPVVKLSSSPYKHDKYGRIFNPIITVARWLTLAQAKGGEAGPKKAKRQK